jgi:hypothetical protein
LLLVSVYGFIWAIPSWRSEKIQDKFFIPSWFLARFLIYPSEKQLHTLEN